MIQDHELLLKMRAEEYGETYQIVDRWIRENIGLLAASPSPYSLIMIYAKLTRSLTSPNKQDHYDDIIGYTKLLLGELEAAEQRKAARERTLEGVTPGFGLPSIEVDISTEEGRKELRRRIKMRGFEG